jgi:hypothetical protein
MRRELRLVAAVLASALILGAAVAPWDVFITTDTIFWMIVGVLSLFWRLWRWALQDRLQDTQRLLNELTDAEHRELMHRLTRYSDAPRTMPARSASVRL